MKRTKTKRITHVEEYIEKIIIKYHYEKTSLIAILQEIQDRYKYLSKDALTFLSWQMDMPLSRVFEVATFYNAFSLKPQGKHLIEVCAGTACHVKGGVNVLAKLERELNVACGETTTDMMFTLEKVRCLGCCSLAPAMRIGGYIHANLTQEDIPRIIQEFRR